MQSHSLFFHFSISLSISNIESEQQQNKKRTEARTIDQRVRTCHDTFIQYNLKGAPQPASRDQVLRANSGRRADQPARVVRIYMYYI